LKKYFSIAVIALLAVSILAGCSGKSGNQSTPAPSASSNSPSASSDSKGETSGGDIDPNETGILNLDWQSSVGTDSVFENPWADMQSLYPELVFDTLVELGMDGQTVAPGLAKSLDVSADGKTYTFTLQEDVKWHDGAPFTADDVLFSYNTLLAVPESKFKSGMTGIVGAQAVLDGTAKTMSGVVADGNKVTFSLSSPDSSLIASIFASVFILPQHLLKDVDPTLFTKNEAFWKKPIGTGAYQINEISFPNFFSLVRNDEYFGVKPKIKNVLFSSHATGGVEAVITDLIAGKLDYAYGSTVNDINNAKNVVEKNPDIKMIITPSTYQRQFWFNNVGSSDNKYNADVQKAEVRQALDLLIDKEAIAGLYSGQAVALSTWVNPDLPAYNTDIPLFKRDVDQAKSMLASAGFDFGRPIRILYYYDDQTTKDLMELIKQNFADAGVKAEPFLATGDLASIIYKVKNWDIMYAGNGLLDPVLTYSTLVPDQGNLDGLFGDVEFRKSTFGSLLTAYKATNDPAELKRIGNQLQEEARKYAMILPIYGMNKVSLYNAAKLQLNEDFFKIDRINTSLDDWQLLK